MIAHWSLTLLTMTILAFDLGAFDSTGQILVEVGSEWLLLTTSIIVGQILLRTNTD